MPRSRVTGRPGIGFDEYGIKWVRACIMAVFQYATITMPKVAIIAGAGPAGLTAALELLRHTDITPIVFEKSDIVGGISQTYTYNGNGIDIGGHRFFSKSDRVIEWWTSILPIQRLEKHNSNALKILYHGKSHVISLGTGPDPDQTDEVMLVCNRKSRILFNRAFIPYPLNLSLETMRALGFTTLIMCTLSYIRYVLFPIKEEKTLRDFLINRFGLLLYKNFFESYTEKVWGLPCEKISAEWGRQRIKGISISKAISHALSQVFTLLRPNTRKTVETSLIEYFLYPKYGPGQMWNTVVDRVRDGGGEVRMNHEVVGLKVTELNDGENQRPDRCRVAEVTVRDVTTGKNETVRADYFFSSMPIKQLIQCVEGEVPSDVREVSDGLPYRDFITVGVLLSDMHNVGSAPIDDNWVYIQESDVRVGRIQFFHNWSRYLVRDENTCWIGMEYFCSEGDDLSTRTDDEMKNLAKEELVRLGLIDSGFVLDMCVLRMPKAYPAYFGTYNRLDEVRAFVDPIENMFLIGRNGMHKYNNQDHSMLTAMESVQNIANGIVSKENIWMVNTEEDYHEEK